MEVIDAQEQIFHQSPHLLFLKNLLQIQQSFDLMIHIFHNNIHTISREIPTYFLNLDDIIMVDWFQYGDLTEGSYWEIVALY
jgi:hypothetical protein